MKALLTSLFALATLAAAALPAAAGPTLRSTAGGVTIALEGEAGQSLPTYYHRGTTYVLGEMGTRYNVRITNGSNERVEVVLTVDGRDAISGDNGDWRNQRGYLVPPYGSIVVDGFRRNYSEVAAFRFTTRGDSYSGRRGTPQNAGVIGAAVFREAYDRPQTIAPPISPYPYPHPQPSWGYRGGIEEDEAAGATAQLDKKGGDGLGTAGEFEARRDAPAAPAPAEKAPAADDAVARTESVSSEPMAAPKGKASTAYGPGGGGYAARPAPRKNNLGTQYGESRYSPVTETAFRRRTGSPDSILGLYYDDAAGLAARGIAVYGAVGSASGPQPFPVNRRFAPPPP